MQKQKLKIGIVGFGRFGTLVASILSKCSDIFICHDRVNYETKSKAKKIKAKLVKLEELSECDIIILATPISKTEKIIKKLAKIMKPGSILIDTCSVKTRPCQWLKKHAPKNIQILGTHPMFGPVTSKFDFQKQSWKLDDKQIVLCPLRISKNNLGKIKKFLKKLKLEIIIATPEDHDKQNAKTLGLVHFLGRALVKSDIKEQEIFTPGYADLLKIIPHTTSDNWQLFFDMHNYNPYAKVIREKLTTVCDELDNKIIVSQEKNELENYREIIDKIDNKIIDQIEKRMAIVKKVGEYKKKNNLPILDKKREEELLKKLTGKSRLNKKFIKNLFENIIKESKNRQK